MVFDMGKSTATRSNELKFKKATRDSEPIFTRWLDRTTGDTQFLKEWLSILLVTNDKDMKTPNRNTTYQDKAFAEEIFLIANTFKLAPEARFLACAIFDKFMYEHLRYLYNYVEKSSDPKKTWDAIQSRVKKQLLLRLISCCQLASKMFSHYNIITVQRAKSYLRKQGQHYADDVIFQSELRILKTLDYKIAIVTPSLYVDTFLAFIGLNIPKIEIKPIHTLCMDLLSIVFIKWAEVYDRLHQMVIGASQISQEDRVKFSEFERDNVLLSGAIITAATHITNPDDNEAILDQLVLITKSTADDFVDLAGIVLDMLGCVEDGQSRVPRSI